MNLSVYEIPVWGHTLKIFDPNSITAPYVAKDMEIDAQGCRDFRTEGFILDVGAHVGIFSIALALNNPKAKIFAVEATSKNFESLKINLEINNIKNVTPILSAVGDGSEIALFEHPLNSGSTSFFNPRDYKEHRVKTVSLEELMNKVGIPTFDLVKFDIEGMEYLTLRAFKEWERIKKLTLEMHKLDIFTEEQNTFVVDKMIEFVLARLPADCFSYSNPNTLKICKWGVLSDGLQAQAL